MKFYGLYFFDWDGAHISPRIFNTKETAKKYRDFLFKNYVEYENKRKKVFDECGMTALEETLSPEGISQVDLMTWIENQEKQKEELWIIVGPKLDMIEKEYYDKMGEYYIDFTQLKNLFPWDLWNSPDGVPDSSCITSYEDCSTNSSDFGFG